MFSQYEVQHQTNNFQQSSVNALPAPLPGFTPVLMNVPIFPQENAGFAPLPMQMPMQQPFNPIFIQPPSSNNVPNLSPVFLPMPSPNFVPTLSNSPPQQMMPMLSLSPIPPLVSISSPPQMSQSVPPNQ